MGSRQVLNLATLAVGDVTPGEAVMSTMVVGSAVRATYPAAQPVAFDLRASARCVRTTNKASNATPMEPTIPVVN